MPSFSKEFIQRVADLNDIVDVINSYIPLKKNGASFVALCPFHQEKTPSFSVNAKDQYYHCFGCGEGGDVFKFIMKQENLTFPESVKFLAERVGLPLEYSSKVNKQAYDQRNLLYEINQKALEFFHSELKKSKLALSYLKTRHIRSKSVKTFKLGYAPNSWDSCFNYLTKLGYSQKDILKSGLVNLSKTNKYFDRFRNRIIYPIYDPFNHVIGFGARAIEETEKAKYLNSPETEIFRKRESLYNLNRAKKNLKQYPFILVEGYMDVIALDYYGFTTSIAALGTAFTKEHIRLLKAYGNEVIICFDSDLAGLKATFKALKVLSNSGLKLKILRLPKPHDPDSFLNTYGKDAFEILLKTAQNETEFYLNYLKQKYDLNKSDELITYTNRALKLISQLNPVEKEIYLKKISTQTGLDKKTLENIKYLKPVKKETKILEKRALEEAENYYLNCLYQNPELIFKNINQGDFSSPFLNWLYKKLNFLGKEKPTVEEILADQDDLKYADELKELIQDNFYINQNHLNKAINIILNNKRKQKELKLHADFQEASENKIQILEALIQNKRGKWNND